MARGYAGPEDPHKGKPYRHTRAKIELMLDEGEGLPRHEDLLRIILKLADKHPVDVLDAIVEALETSSAP